MGRRTPLNAICSLPKSSQLMLSSLVLNGNLLPSQEPQTPVPWWSFTKTVLAATALSLVRDGLTGLDEPLPEGAFSLRQLLRHEAGLADYGELADYHAAVANNETPWPVNQMMQRLDAARLRYVPGAGWRYSNVGYLLVARLIERVTGMALEEAITQRTLKPLDITRVRLAKTTTDLQDVCLGTAAHYDPAWVYHGLLVGPLAQAALLLDRLLSGGFLPQGLLREMQTTYALGGPIPGRPWLSPSYGLGLMQSEINGNVTLRGHTGCGPSSIVAIYRCAHHDQAATCAVFHEGNREGDAEAEVVARLMAALG
jgi:CubicO group peptidase (beta-lactamase class C family)